MGASQGNADYYKTCHVGGVRGAQMCADGVHLSCTILNVVATVRVNVVGALLQNSLITLYAWSPQWAGSDEGCQEKEKRLANESFHTLGVQA